MSPLRVAVIGVGALGKHHARILSSMPGVSLAAVVDINRARAEEIAAAHGTRALFDAGQLDGQVDAVTIAVPTESHQRIARPFLEAGIPALVEKPIARTVAEADAMIAVAARTGAALAVGHTERFNPAIAAARQVVSAGNLANANTPGFRAVDVAPFEAALEQASLAMKATEPGHVTGGDAGLSVQTTEREGAWEVSHSGNNVSLEQELVDAGDTNRAYRLNTSIAKAFHRMLLASAKV